ncbi:MAG: starch-binding protein [Ruminococcus sp.]|nr:starch-binding protein [Ruminococcus sp.]
MTRKFISALLSVAMLLSIAICAPANAASADDESTGYNQKTKLQNPDDFSWDNASVYFLMTDRFYNGNTSNDHSYGRTTDASGRALSGWNTAPGTFHGGDFAGVTKKINEGYFDDLGVNAIWISAPYEQIHGFVDSGDASGHFAHYSYHGYYVLDYTETDANFGTKAEFKTLVDTAHRHGIRVIMDIVMNHAGYNNIVDMETYNYGKITNRSAIDAYKYKLTNVEGFHQYIDYSSSASDWGRWWGSGWVRSGLPGYSEGGGGDIERCLEGLPDFRTESKSSVSIPTFLQTKWKSEGTYNTKVQKFGSSNTVTGYISSWLADWVSTYGVDGFRCDTAKHVEYASWNTLKTKCVAALKQWRQANPSAPGADWTDDFWMTGEHWNYKLGYGDYYTQGGFDSMINFSFSGSGVPAVGSINGVYQNYASTINNQANFNALSYISSHDSDLARNDLIYQGSAFQLLPGAVQIFYGDETNRPRVSGLGFDGHGGSGHSLRSDMNWTSADQNILKHWQKVGKFRSRHVAVGAGKHQQITGYNSSTGYVFSRSYDNGIMSDEIIAVISAPKNTNLAVNVSSMWGNGTTVTNAYDGTTAVVQNGKATFNTGANGTILIEGPQSTIHMSIDGDYSFFDSQTVKASIRGADYATVSVAGGSPFRVTNGQTFEIGDGIEKDTTFEVTMTATNSEETLNKSFSFKKIDPEKKVLIVFDNSQYKWSTVNAYVYNDSGSQTIEKAKWPGVAMKKFDSEHNLYVLEIDPLKDSDLMSGKVIFNAGESSANRYPADMEPGLEYDNQSMVFSYGNKWEPYTGVYVPGTEPTTTPPDPDKFVTIYYDNSNTGYNPPYIYFWNSKTDSGSEEWPGVQMTRDEGNIYKATFLKEYDRCIFSNNGASKTDDLTFPGSGYMYKNGSWIKYKEVVPTTKPVEPTTQKVTTPQNPDGILIGDANTDNCIDILDVTHIQYALAKFLTLNDAQKIAADSDMDGVVSIRDATAIQYYLVSLKSKTSHVGERVNGSNPQQPTNPPVQPTNPPVQPTTAKPAENEGTAIYYQNTNNWPGVTAYYWSNANETMTSWPGKAMTSLGNGIYKIELPQDAEYVIFSNNGVGKTNDIKLAGFGKLYKNGSWINYSEGQTVTDPVLTGSYVYFKNTRNFNPVKAYFWSEENKNIMTWPGNNMESVGNGVFRSKIPDGATMVIFNDGNEQTDDLSIPGPNMVYDGSGWSGY